MEALLDGEAEAITRVSPSKRPRKAIATALRLCLERFCRDARIGLSILTASARNGDRSAGSHGGNRFAAVAAADITVSEGSELARLVDSLIARTHWPPLRVARDAPSKEPAASLCFLCTIRGHSICYFSVKITQMASRSRHRTQATDRARSSTKARGPARWAPAAAIPSYEGF